MGMVRMFENLWLILLGFIAGILGSIIGLGGGIITMPVLTFIGVPHTIAANSSLFAAFSNAVASTISYTKQRRIEFKIGLRLGLLSIPGTVLGALLSAQVTPPVFKILFGLVLIGSCYYIIVKRNIMPKSTNTSAQMAILSAAISFSAGLLSSFFGIGGGIVFVPLMIVGLGMVVKHATATSQLILLFSSFSGMIAHSLLGHADYEYALLLSTGAFAGGLLGAKISVDIRESGIRILVCAAILIAAVKLFYDAFSI
jgi:uncharacterized protein